MDAALTAIIDQLNACTEDVKQLLAQTDEAALKSRPAPAAWSAAECITHLNITNRALIPAIDAGIARGTRLAPGARPRYARDPLGWILSVMLEPPAKWSKTPTITPFIPGATKSKAAIAQEFAELNGQLIDRVHKADGLQWGLIVIQSLFNEKIKYNLYSAYRITTAHERRHVWQARRAVAGSHL